MKRGKREKNKVCGVFFYLNPCFTKRQNSAREKNMF